MSARANGRATWSCCTKSPTAPPTAATASPSPSWPGFRRRSWRAPSRCSPSSRRAATRPAGLPPGSTICRLFAAGRAGSRAPTRWPRRSPRSTPTPDPARGAGRALRAEAARRRAADAAATALRADRRSPRDHRPPRRSPTGSPRCRAASARPRSATSCAKRSTRAAPKSPGASTAEPGARPRRGARYAFLPDQIVRLAYDLVASAASAPSRPRRAMALVGLGGTGRGEMAPFSDLDLMFLVARPPTPWREQVVEALLYLLWDLKLKVGQSVRTLDELIALAQGRHDHPHRPARSALAVGRRGICSTTAMQRFRKRRSSPAPRAEFVAAKLAERDERHRRMGDSRYVVEPNVKDGKGGLRDLHTLYWIGKYVLRRRAARRPGRHGPVHRRRIPPLRARRALLLGGALPPPPRRRPRRGAAGLRPCSARSPRRCATPTGPGKSAVERFMQFYFLNAKAVGDLTGLFLAQLDEQMGEQGPPLRAADASPPAQAARRLHARPRAPVDPRRRLACRGSGAAGRAVRAGRARGAGNPPRRRCAPRRATRGWSTQVRDDPRANALFLEVLTDRDKPDLVLRWMNEAGVFGRFVPDFGRVVAQMQFDMYHHYTVDEHSIRAIGLLAAIERGELADDHPLSTALVPPDRVAPRALCRGAAARHRQGPRRRP